MKKAKLAARTLTFAAVITIFLAGCSTLRAENLSLSVSVSDEFALIEDQPTMQAQISLQGVSDQRIKVVLQKDQGNAWVDQESKEILIEDQGLVEFQIEEEEAGRYQYRVSLANTDSSEVYLTSESKEIQIDNLSILVRDLFYGEQQSCNMLVSTSVCIDYLTKNQYPGLFDPAAYRQHIKQFDLTSSNNPDLETLMPDPDWTLSEPSRGLDYKLDVSKPLPGKTFTVVVTNSVYQGEKTVHVTYLEGRVYFYQW